MNQYTGLEIAVIGLSGRFPGADTIHKFWEMVRDGRDCISTFSKEDAMNEGETEAVCNDPAYVLSNAYLSNKHYFDYPFFNYRPDEAALMDPQIRIFHECCWQALEDAGYASNKQINIGLFAAGTPNVPWVLHAAVANRQQLVDDFTAAQLRDTAFLSSLVAYRLNLKGPAIYLQTACSSSLVAIHEACNSVLLGECSIALAGGVNIQHYSKKGYVYKEGMIHSRDGRCRPFDSRAAGTVNGEGAGVVVLKKLKDALRDGDHVYAIIKGSAINNDGSSKVGFTAPSVAGQAEVIKRAHRMAKVDPQSITYVETHGTATALGDPIEVEALNKAFGNRTEKSCALGAVKSNIGHLDSAAGVAGFIKTVLAIHHRQIPPVVHFQEPNPEIDFKNGPFYVNTMLKEWNNTAGPLRAGVSSFGIGGTNAHMVLEEAPALHTLPESRPFQLIVLSGKTSSALENNCNRFTEYLQHNTGEPLADIAYTLQTGRERFKHRQALVCESREEAIRLLTSGAWQQHVATNVQEELQNVVFLFSGQGSQYPNMCRELYLHEIVFRQHVEDCLGRLKQFSSLDFYGVLFPADDVIAGNTADINNTQYAQPLLFVIEYSLAQLLMQWGIRPAYMIGHSIGEYVAACISGVISLNDALRLVTRRGELMGSVEKGTMLAVDVPEDTLQPLLAKYPKIDLAVVNTNNSLVVAGAHDDIAEFESVLVSLGHNCKKLHTSHAFHSRMMDSILDAFESELATVTIQPPSIPYISNLSGDFVQFEEVRKPGYWTRHLRSCVQFCKGAQTLLQLGNGLFIEVGPGRSLCNYISGNALKNNGHTVINLVRQAKQQVSDEKYLVEKLGQLWLNGIDIQWNEYYAHEKRKRVSLPGYCFDRLPLTTDFDLNNLLHQTLNGNGHEQKKPVAHCIHVRDWKKTILPNEATELKERQSVFLAFRGNESFSAAVIDHLVSLGQQVIDIKPGETFRHIKKDQFEVDLSEPAQLAQLFRILAETGTTVGHIIYCATLYEPAPIQFGDLQMGLRNGYLGISYIAKAIAGSGLTANIQVTVIANQLAMITEEDVIDPVKAIVHAPVRIAPSEIMNVTAKVIDIPYPVSRDSITSYLSKITNELFFEPEEPFVVYRMGQRWVPFFDSWNSNKKTGSGITIKNDGVYLVIGGMGGIGFTLANDIAHRYQSTLVIVYRSAFPAREAWNDWLIEKGEDDGVSRKIRQLMAMERAGSTIKLYQANITQQEEVQALIHTLQRHHGKINGIIWSAGEIDYGGIMLNRHAEDFIAYSSSKIHGLLLMQQYLDFASLDFLALFSSVGNVIYQVKFGQVGYNAGNEFLENYAAYAQRRFGIHAFAINWCDWMDVGLTVKAVRNEFPLADIKTINSKIAHAIYPKDGISIFYDCLENKVPVYTIFPGNLVEAILERRRHVKEIRATKEAGETTTQRAVINDKPEDQLVAIYSGFFGTNVAVTDNFFELGGDSLKAMSLVARINQQLGVRLAISDMYSCPTIQELLVKLSAMTAAATERSAIPKVAVQEYYATSSEQKRMYFLQLVNEQSVLYNETEVLEVQGAFDKDRAERIFNLLIERHESLRSVFVLNENGELCQRVEKEWQFSIEELENAEGQTDKIIETFIRPFDLSTAPFLRVGVMNRGAQEYMLVIDSHHIVMDGVSRLVLRDEFNALYSGNQLPGLHLQYKDYAAWQQGSLHQDLINRQRDYWLREFSEELPVLELPADFQRPPVKNYQGDVVRWELTPAQTTAIRSMAASAGTTVFTVLLSALNILLSKLCNQEDIIIGIPVAGRQHADLERMIGMFVNTLALRNYPQGEKRFRDFLAEVSNRSVAGFENQLLPFEELVNLLQIGRNSSRNPLFDVMFVYQHYEESKYEPADIIIRPRTIPHTSSRFDVTLLAVEENDHLFLRLLYSTELFKKASVQRFADRFGKIIAAVLADPDIRLCAIDTTSEAEKQQLLIDCNNTLAEEVQGKTVIGLFYDQVIKTPGNTALVHGQNSISYRQLGDLAATIAWQVKRYTGNEKSCIGLLFFTGIEMVAAILGVMKAGCVAVPLSPDAPDDRNTFIITDCNAALILTDTHTHKQKRQFLQAHKNVLLVNTGETNAAAPVAEDHPVSPADLVYINYTSGTSGKPKGVKVTHASLVNYVLWKKACHRLIADDVTLQTISYHFDGFAANSYPTLLSGGTMVMIPEEHKLDAVYIAGVIRKEQVTNLTLLPGFYTALIEQFEVGEKPDAIRFVVVAGERAAAALVKKHRSVFPAVELGNEYGPTESTVSATHHPCLQEENPAVIGKPIWNTSVYILGKENDLLPTGTWGEICISGAGVAAGYLNNDQLTREKFVSDPFVPGRMMYRTGDLGRWRPDGSLEMNGRIDDQVKVRGYRIEPAEIENCLTGFNGIRQVVVIAPGKQGQKYLVTYYVCDFEIPVHEIKHFLSGVLPAYMVPEIYIRLEALPYTLNGKIDRKKLPPPLLLPQLEKTMPVTNEEEILVNIWSAVLGIDNIGTTDNFFSIGGDSIKSIQICSRLRGMGYVTSVKDIFTCQTIQRLGAQLQQASMMADQSLVTGTVALSPVQRWFFNTFTVQPHHFCQSVMLHFQKGITGETVIKLFQQLLQHHDALRMVCAEENGENVLMTLNPTGQVYLQKFDIRDHDDAGSVIIAESDRIRAGIDLEKGPLLRLGLFHTSNGSRLLIIIHHLVIDAVSWRILFEDIQTLLTQMENRQPLVLPLKTTSWQQWSQQLLRYEQHELPAQAASYWKAVAEQQAGAPQRDYAEGFNRFSDVEKVSVQLDNETTHLLLTKAHQAFNTRINDILLTALWLAVKKKYNLPAVFVDMEGHGRESVASALDVTRTVGWFTTIYPVLLQAKDSDWSVLIREVKENLRTIPSHGMDYLMLEYPLPSKVHRDATSRRVQSPISFNYLGQFDTDVDNPYFSVAEEHAGDDIAPDANRVYDWDISGMIVTGRLTLQLAYSRFQYKQETMVSFLNLYRDCLQEIIRYCCARQKTLYSPSDFTFNELSLSEADRLQQAYDLADVYPLSPMQEGMLFHSLLDVDSSNYFEQMTYAIQGTLDIAALEQSMNYLVERYDTLRTLFLHKGYGMPLQVVLKNRKIDFQYKDIREACVQMGTEPVIEGYRQQDRGRTFNLSHDLLMRLMVLQVSETGYVFIWSHHHVLMDGWCMTILVNEFLKVYAAIKHRRAIVLPPVKPYSTYIKWLRDRKKEPSAAYWSNYLAGYDRLASLPQKEIIDRKSGYRLAVQEFTVSKEQSRLLKAKAGEYSVTVNTLLHTAWGILLAKYNNVNDVVFGTVVSGRPPEIEGVEKMVGLFINTIPVRVQYSHTDDTGSLIKRMQQQALEAEMFQYQPLFEIQALSEPGRGLLNHIMVIEDYPLTKEMQKAANANVQQEFTLTGVEIFEQANYDIVVSVIPGEETQIKIDYNANVYDKEMIERAGEHLLRTIAMLTADSRSGISGFEIITGPEKNRILNSFNKPDMPFANARLFVDAFEEQVALLPDAVAVVHNQEQLTYRQLNEKANQLAAFLHAKAERQSNIPVLMDPCVSLLISMIGIFKAGMVYVPLNTDLPLNRITENLLDLDARVLLTDGNYKAGEAGFYNTLTAETNIAQLVFIDGPRPPADASLLIADCNDLQCFQKSNIGVEINANDACYIIYTSGTTGKPKGAIIHHAGMINHLYAKVNDLVITANDVIAQTAPVSFDISIWQLLACLITGGRTCIIDREKVLQPQLLLHELTNGAVTIFESVPSLLVNMLDTVQAEQLAVLGKLKWMILTGEQLSVSLVKNWFAVFPHTRLLNAYGPTEASDDITHYIVEPPEEGQHSIPVGKPIQNMHIYILDNDLHLCPVGVRGEICVAGVGVGKGYWKDPDKTKKVFITNPVEDPLSHTGVSIVYKTGDIGYFQENGNIVCLGRTDSQVKIRGVRIELGEIEARLAAYPLIHESVVLSYGKEEDKYLAAYFVASVKIDIDDLKKFLLQQLPAYMVPACYMQLKEIPVTVNGKLNRKALPDPQVEFASEYVLPANTIEEQLVTIWSEILKIGKEKISTHAGFFDLGGHSLKATVLANKMQQQFGIEVPLKEIFDKQTIRDISDYIITAKQVEDHTAPVNELIEISI